MGTDTKIEWAHHTFNPWIGCSKVSAGCQNCYAEEMMDHRYGKAKWGPDGTRVRTSESNWKEPLRWNRQAVKQGIRYRVFCASLADVFEDRPELDQWRFDLLNLIVDTPNLDWLLLTKRPENVMPMVGHLGLTYGVPCNVWIGTSVENQEQADKRIPELLKIPAKLRFLSMEPLLGPVCLQVSKDQRFIKNKYSGTWMYNSPYPSEIHWVIVGGESGYKARPMQPEWAQELRDQCLAAVVPFFFKQGSSNNWPRYKEPASFPPGLQIREVPRG